MSISIFLSHTAADKEFVRKIARDLDNHGVKYWLDEAEIKVGDSLIEKIRNGLDEVDYVAVIPSPNSIASSWVQREIDVAMNQEIVEESRQIRQGKWFGPKPTGVSGAPTKPTGSQSIPTLEPAGAAHGAVITGFAARFEGAGLFVLEEVDQFGDGRFFNSKSFLTGMQPRGVNTRNGNFRFDLD